MVTIRRPVSFYTLPYFAISKNHFVCCKDKGISLEKEFSPNYFREAVLWKLHPKS